MSVLENLKRLSSDDIKQIAEIFDIEDNFQKEVIKKIEMAYYFKTEILYKEIPFETDIF